MTKEIDLLPCPFCGSTPYWCADRAPEKHECHMIVCPGCDLEVDLNDNPDTETVAELQEIMAKKWNRRV